MRKETITIYQYSELSVAAQAKARDWFRQAGQDDQWWTDVYERAKAAGALIGFDITNIGFSGFWSQGDGANFTGSLGYVKGGLKALEAAWPNDTALRGIANDWQAIQRQNFFKVTGTVSHRGRYQHSNSNTFEVYRNGACANDDLESSVESCARAFMDWIYSELEEEYEFLNSDDTVAQCIISNEYEFTVDGSVH